MGTLGLSVNNVVSVDVVLSPTAARTRNFGNLMIFGDSAVIDTTERLRLYTDISSIGTDFGTTAPEYMAAQLFFSQSPQPAQVYIGRWARTATAAQLNGAVLSTAQQALSNFTAITTGSFRLTIDGTLKTVSGLDLSSATNLNGVASLVQAKLSAGQTCTWSSSQNRFIIKSSTTGTGSTITFAEATGSGTDVTSLLGFGPADGGYIVQGIAAETLVDGINVMADLSVDWYGLYVASSVVPSDNTYIAAASAVEALSPVRIMGITTQTAGTLDSATTTDLASQLKALAYKRTFVQFSSNSPHAAVSALGRAFTVNFSGSNTTITLKFKQEPGVAPENLTQTQANTLAAKNCNVFVKYNNDTSILQQGVMSSGNFFDEIHGTDWLQNDVQTSVYNVLYTSTTKVPQTDQGINLLLTTVEQRLAQAVTNGLVAPGVWNASGFGNLKQGDTLTKGYYVYAAPVATQSQADREARKAPLIQSAIKLAGAVHSVNIVINVNR